MRTILLMLVMGPIVGRSAVADELPKLTKEGQLLFADDFDRDDGSADKDAIGNGWTSNSPWRADGRKQVFLRDGAVTIRTAEGASHGAVMFHDIDPEFQDGMVQVTFRADPGEAFSIDLNDPQCKSVHAGHIANVALTGRGITVKDSKTGAMDLEIRKRLKAGDQDLELKKLVRSKAKTFPFKPEKETRHTLTIITRGETLQVFVDGRLLGTHQSAGFAHPTKRKINISVPSYATSSPELEEIKVWRLSQ